ncbi:MAG TPA: CHASE domain-containing protein [Polyangiales bacterium]|nr:CHASE domain-containing protein [Polyangiales bacterium]
MTSNSSEAFLRLVSVRSLGGLPAHRSALVVFVVGVLVSVGLWSTLRARVQDRERVEFQRRVGEVAGGLRVQLKTPLEVLDSVCALFDASIDVQRDEFARFVRPALVRHPGIRALEWIPLVPASSRAAYERAARADGLTAFEFRQTGPDGRLERAGDRPEHLPIYFMEPGDDRVFGFDLTSEADRQAPVERARERRATVASGRMRLIEDPPGMHSIAVFCPVFARGRLLGVGAEVFRMRSAVEPAIASALALGMQVVVSDVAAPPDTRVLFESSRGLTADGRELTRDSLHVRIAFADREWSASFSRGPRYRTELSEPPWGILIAGIALSCLIALGISTERVIRELRREVQAAQHLGQYTLIRKLGEGGMGVVWEARHALLRRPTAIKLLRPERAGADAISRFEREVQLTSQLTHPNTVAIYDYGHTAAGVFYYVMEYLDGYDLQRLIALDGPQPASRVVHIMKQVASALAEAHGRGLVHRDVKPANIVLCERGGMHDVAKVVDFGLVKGVEPDPTLSRDQAILGTPLFLAPEAINDPQHVDARSDIYACGALTYYLLTGQPVFDGPTLIEICSQHLYATPQPPSERVGRALPADVERVVLRCLEKQPGERYEDAGALFAALDACDVPGWTQVQAEAAFRRVADRADPLVATARTLPVDSPSALAIDLGRRVQDPQT